MKEFLGSEKCSIHRTEDQDIALVSFIWENYWHKEEAQKVANFNKNTLFCVKLQFLLCWTIDMKPNSQPTDYLFLFWFYFDYILFF